MPDAITPVAAQIQAPNALGTMSSILGLQQQRQALQGQAAQVQQEQLKAQQASGVQNFFQSFDPTQHMGADGTIDLDSALQDSHFRGAGNAKPAIMQSLLDIKNKQLTNKQALTSLNGANLSQLSSVIGSLAKDEDVLADKTDPQSGVNAGRAKVGAAFDNFSKLGPDAARVAAIYKPMVEGAPAGKLSTGIQSLQMQAQDVAGQQAQQNPALVPVARGSETDIFNVNKPEGLQPGQAPAQRLGMGLAPQVVTPPGGVPAIMGGMGGGGGGAPGQPNQRNLSGFPGPQPTDQDMKNFGDYQNNLNQRVAIASDSIPRIQMAENALDSIRGGAGAPAYAKWAQRLQALHMPQDLVDAVANGNLAKAQEAEKLLFQTTFSGLRQSMQGDPARVAEFQSAEKVFPSISTDPRAAKEILGFMVDQGNRDYAEQQALLKARTDHTFNPVTWQGEYQQRLRAGAVPGVPASQNPSGGIPTVTSQSQYDALPKGAKYIGADGHRYTKGGGSAVVATR